MIGGQAPMAMAIMWALTVVTWIMVILRTYTRAVIVQHVGPDDHVYILTGVSYPPPRPRWGVHN